MISEKREQNALCALNNVLILARRMAYDGVPGIEIAEILDVAEYLPRLMADQEDRTESFRRQLVDLAAKRPEFGLALRRFDDSELSIPW